MKAPDDLPPSGEEAHAGALDLLRATRAQQRGRAREVAWAWERAAFAEAFLSPEPARRVQAFLRGKR